MQILPGVCLVQGFACGRHQDSYAVRTDDGRFLVDSGDLGDDSFPDFAWGRAGGVCFARRTSSPVTAIRRPSAI